MIRVNVNITENVQQSSVEELQRISELMIIMIIILKMITTETSLPTNIVVYIQLVDTGQYGGMRPATMSLVLTVSSWPFGGR